jgi:hypothetical protein
LAAFVVILLTPCLPARAGDDPPGKAANADPAGDDPAAQGGAQGGGGTAAPQDSIVVANGRVRIGAVFFGDWEYYTKTGFGPQFLTQVNPPGPGNDNFNAFAIHRTYINLFWIPSDHLTFRLTPNLFREAGQTTADKLGKVSAFPTSVDGNLTLRVKYAYMEFGNFVDSSSAYRGTNVRFGSQMNPVVDWQEALYDYRFVNLIGWNYLSLSSTQVGIALNGQIGPAGKQYLDYQIGVFNDTNFHQFEQSEQKQFMVRGSVYPFGATSRFQGLGLTGFYDHGYTNAAPDTGAFPVVRGAALAHYAGATNQYQIAVEYDWGKNAFSTNNMFSGSGPQDLFGVGTTQFAKMTQLAQAVLAGTEAKQKGYEVFGHANIPGSKFAVFGLWQYFQPNTNVPSNPLDFDRIIGGVAYRVSPRWRFAVDSQNLIYRHSQFTYPASSIASFSPSLAAANPNGIDNAVPPNIKAIFVNVEFTF